MKLDIKKRLRSKTFLVAIFSLLVLFAQQVGAAFGEDLTMISDKATELFNTVLMILVLVGVVVDPTTKGIGDNTQGKR